MPSCATSLPRSDLLIGSPGGAWNGNVEMMCRIVQQMACHLGKKREYNLWKSMCGTRRFGAASLLQGTYILEACILFQC